ncbi:signal peptide and transmembrane prediction [Enhygromyxa salina]|uniref:Signal peptide and transmembrane prediction n=1 Tax=Enhygromyxa salina TaxID=215803 RepID=A0A0C1ZUT0_9BACT|nr:signal peptide and transmembrane prediction [Enhygromyxa salina]
MRSYQVEVWADNWSSMYLDETLLMEDAEPITQERSFNAEIFSFEATPPFGLNVIMKDFIENDSGLEYIGEPNQQMGDGGYIMQVTDMESGERVVVSDASWRCLTIHEAPLNKECESSASPLDDCEWEIGEEPDGWKSAAFDDAAWVAPSVYTSEQVQPKEGYNEISWDPDAQFIWGADLETHNTLLCRVTVEG